MPDNDDMPQGTDPGLTNVHAAELEDLEPAPEPADEDADDSEDEADEADEDGAEEERSAEEKASKGEPLEKSGSETEQTNPQGTDPGLTVVQKETNDPGIMPAQYRAEDRWGDTPMQMRTK